MSLTSVTAMALFSQRALGAALASAVVGITVTARTAAAQTFYGPTPYLSFADSPFNGLSFSSFFLETFEDGSLNTPNVTLAGAAPFVTASGGFTDSVDGDDGVIDGSGAGGRSLYSQQSRTEFLFTFAAGFAPTHVGIVWTDVGSVSSGNASVGGVLFEAFGPGGVSLGTTGPVTLGDGTALSATAEDRFFGAFNAAGITSFRIAMNNSVDWEVDHLQYGIAATAVPEPATAALVLGGLAVLAGVRARRRR